MRNLLALVLGIAAVAALVWWTRRDSAETSAPPSAENSPAGERLPADVAPSPEPGASAPRQASTELPPATRTVAGRVVDARGVALADDVEVLALDAHGTWLARQDVDREGRFAFPSLPAGAVALEPRCEGWFARERAPIDAGAEETLVLERGGRIEGSLILDPVLGSRGAFVYARREGTPDAGRFGEIESDGSFALEGLDTGSYAVELVGDGEGLPVAPLHSIPHVTVRRETTTRDPRLFGLALPALVGVVQVTFEDVGGASVRGALVHVLDLDGAVLARVRATKESVSLPIPLDRPTQALVTHEDFGPARVDLAPPSVRVVLAPGIRLRLRPTLPQPLDRGSIGAFLSLRPELPELADLPEGAFDVPLPLSLGSEESTEVVFPLEGRYRLLCVLRERMGSRFGSSPDERVVTLDEGIDVRAQDEGLVRDFWLPPDLFERAAQGADERGRPRR